MSNHTSSTPDKPKSLQFRSLLEKVQSRIFWELYVQQTHLRRMLWEWLRSRQVPSYLAQGCLHERHEPHFLSLEEDAILQEPYIWENFSTQTEYLYRLKGTFYIEPDFGYAIMHPFSIIDLALPGAEAAKSRASMIYFSGIPSLRKYILAKMGYFPVRKERSVVLMRYVFDFNYYHFYNDIMNRLRLLDEVGIDNNIPLVVSTHLGKQHFFQHLSRRGLLAKRNWIVQDHFYIVSDEIIFAKPFTRGDRSGIDYFLTCIGAPEANTSANRRIFLTRNPDRGRNILNMDDIIPVLDSFDFEIIDTDNLTIDQQMVIFSEASIVVGIHGAGLVNTVFRRNGTLKLLEIFPPYDTDLSFYILAKAYNYTYDMIRGYQSLGKQRHSPFCLDPCLLQKKLASLCDSGMVGSIQSGTESR